MEIALPVNSITWPPNNWKQMDKVQRAFALQIVMAMVTVGDEEPGNFPLASPPTLLEDYNMLALPGTGTHNDQDHMALARWQLRSALKHMLVAQHHDVHWGNGQFAENRRCCRTPCEKGTATPVNLQNVPLLQYMKGQVQEPGPE